MVVGRHTRRMWEGNVVPSFVRGLVLSACLFSLLAQSTPAAGSAVQDALFTAVGSYRTTRGLPAVAVSPTLQAAAQFMADDVASHGVPAIPHVSSDGRSARQRMADAGYPVDAAFTSEIIAWGATTVAGAMDLWRRSAPHAAVLNDGRYVAAGFGVACYGAYPCVWVVTFGTVVDAAFSAPAVFASHHAAFSAQSAFPVATPGQTVQWIFAITNTGATGWSADNATAARLGTNNPTDAMSPLASTRWVQPNRPAQQTTQYVGPGQQAWFIVELVAPPSPGTYRLYVRPVIDGVQWLEDIGAYVDLVVR
ncbi:MAG TPA: CAP domain-containing protein [Candidatus Limnocylindria bacterium]|nr:CAP domain-containing protein [Candidatus Limnocylindria bacterium]